MTFTPYKKIIMKLKYTLLLIPFLAGCSAISQPISFYQCSVIEGEINSKISKMEEAYSNLVNTINSDKTIQDKNQYTYYNKILVESVKLKVQNDKYHAESGDYSYCATGAKDTINYVEGITSFFNNTNNTIKSLSKSTKDIEAKLNCSSKEECDQEISLEVIKELNNQLNKLSISN